MRRKLNIVNEIGRARLKTKVSKDLPSIEGGFWGLKYVETFT